MRSLAHQLGPAEIIPPLLTHRLGMEHAIVFQGGWGVLWLSAGYLQRLHWGLRLSHEQQLVHCGEWKCQEA